jgi:6-pyruvoyl-tetrahydropterin synthase
MFEAGVSRELNTRHFLKGDFGEESTPHSHEYRFEFSCTVRDLDETGFSADIALLEEAAESAARELDRVLLNDLQYFADKQTSIENMARYIHRLMIRFLQRKGGVPEKFVKSRVTVWESPDAWASFIDEN